jgi:hypothetical protein
LSHPVDPKLPNTKAREHAAFAAVVEALADQIDSLAPQLPEGVGAEAIRGYAKRIRISMLDLNRPTDPRHAMSALATPSH